MVSSSSVISSYSASTMSGHAEVTRILSGTVVRGLSFALMLERSKFQSLFNGPTACTIYMYTASSTMTVFFFFLLSDHSMIAKWW